jgi:hypothetical protein
MDTTEKKSQRFRSVAYPSNTIKESVELTRKINQQFGNSTFNKREDIADQLEAGVGTLLTKLSTAVQYGLLEMKSGEGYKPSDLFTRIYKPLNDDERRNSEVECLLNPELYKKLTDHYANKQLPAIGGLAILLYRSYKVSEDASEKAAKVFLENLTELDLIDSDNRLKSFDDFERRPTPEEAFAEPVPTPIYSNAMPVRKEITGKSNIVNIDSQLAGSAPPIPIFLKGDNRVAKVVLPIDFDNDDIDRVIKVLEVNKRP